MKKVVVVGSINVDLVFTSKIRPKSGETVLGEKFSIIPGGKGANQAVASSKLGVKTYMIGCVGEDSNAEFSINNFQNTNIDINSIERVKSASTGVANIVVAENDNSIIVIPGANYEITTKTVDKYIDVILGADIVLVQLEIPINVVEHTINICKNNNVKIILNPAPATKLNKEMIENSTYITPNEHELRIIFGENEDRDVDEILSQYPNKLIVTLGSEGVKYHNGKEIVNIPAYKVDTKDIVDTTGAGDTFNGALASALIRGDSLEQAIKFANKAAALSITKLGAQTAMPTLKDL